MMKRSVCLLSLTVWSAVLHAQPAGDTPRVTGQARTTPAALPAEAGLLSQLSVVSGIVTDDAGKPRDSIMVWLERDGAAVASTLTDPKGAYSLSTRPGAPGTLRAQLDILSAQQTNVTTAPGVQEIHLTLRERASLSGRIAALDDSPLSSVVVQAVPQGEDGRLPGLWLEVFPLAAGLTNYPAVGETLGRPILEVADGEVNRPLSARQTDDTLWGAANRIENLHNGSFYGRWSGSLRIPATARYTFSLASCGYTRLFLDGRQVIYNEDLIEWSQQERSGTVELTAGEHAIKVEFLKLAPGVSCQLYWSSDAISRQIIPTAVLSHRANEKAVQTAVSDEKGAYAFASLLPGRYRLRAHVAGGVAEPEGGTEVTIARHAPTSVRDFRLVPFKHGVWTSYTTDDGLGGDKVVDLVEAEDGALWFATYGGGVSRFDGRDFLTLGTDQGLVSDNVRAIGTGLNGVIWIGTDKGLCRYNPADPPGPIATFTTTNGLPNDTINCLAQDRDGRLWVGTGAGLVSFNGQSFSRPLSLGGATNQTILSLLADSTGALWIGTWGNGVWRQTVAQGAEGNPPPTHWGRSNGLASDVVRSLFEAADGAFWFGTEGGVSRYDPADGIGAGTWTTFTTRDGLKGDSVYGIGQDPQGKLWFACRPGLCTYDGQGFVHFDARDGLTSPSLVKLHIDRDGEVWVTTLSGVFRFDPDSLVTFTPRDGLFKGDIKQIVETSDQTLWCRVGEVLFRYDGQRFHAVTRTDGVTGSRPSSLYVDADGSLILTDGLNPAVVWKPGTGRRSAPKFQVLEGSPAASFILRTAAGQLWTGGDEGATLWDTTWRILRECELPGVVGAAEGPDGTLWFEGGQKQLWRYDGTNATPFTQGNGLPGRARALRILSDGTVVACTSQGPARFDGGTFVPWPTHAPRRLRGQECYDLVRDERGRLWFATLRGMVGTDGTAWTILDTRDGLLDEVIFSLGVGHDESLWIGGASKGLARYRPATRPPRAPTVNLTSNQPDWTASGVFRVKTGERVSFEFAAVDFRTRPDRRQYRWQLIRGRPAAQALQGGWGKPDPETEVDWTAAEPGDWTLAVQYIDRDLNYSPPTLVPLAIVLPWYANTWITGPTGAGIVGLLGWAFIARSLVVRRKREAQELRERLLHEEQRTRQALEAKNTQLAAAKEEAEQAREAATEANASKSQFLASMSHELRTPLTAIIGFSELLLSETQAEGKVEQSEDLARIQGSATHLLGLINDILDLSKIEARKMELHLEAVAVANMVTEVAKTMEPLVQKNGNRFELDCPADIGSMHTDVVKLRQGLLNLLSNANKFTDKGTVRLEVRRQRSKDRGQKPEAGDQGSAGSGQKAEDGSEVMVFAIHDSGIGMTPEQMGKLFQAFSQAESGTQRKYGGTGLGLAITKQFCEMLGGKVEVESQPGKGSTFTMTLPVASQDR